MTKCKKPTPYDPKLIAEQCNPLALRLGCAAGCWKGENFDMCGKPPVAIRRWGRDDGYDDSGLLPEEGVYGPACKLHANHDVVPLSEVLKAVADAGCWKHDPSLMPPLSFSGVRTPAFRPVVKRLYLCHAGRFWFSMYRLNVSSGAPPAVPA